MCVSVMNELLKCSKDRDSCEKQIRALEREIGWLEVNLKVENDSAKKKSLRDAQVKRDSLRVKLEAHRTLLKSAGIDQKLLEETQEQCQRKYRSLKAMHDKYLAGISAVMGAASASQVDRPKAIKKAKSLLGDAIGYAGSCSSLTAPALEKKIFRYMRSQNEGEQR